MAGAPPSESVHLNCGKQRESLGKVIYLCNQEFYLLFVSASIRVFLHYGRVRYFTQ